MFILYNNKRCENCGEEYTMPHYKWCRQCEINKLRGNFTSWTSGNEKIDSSIQEKQLKIYKPWSIVFEWILHDKFLGIEEVNKDDNSTVYSAQWEDGPLGWNKDSKEYKRKSKKVSLKYLHNSQNVDEFLNEVEAYLINFKIYGVSQNPNTKNYIIVLKNNDIFCIMCNNMYTTINYNKVCKHCEINNLKKNFANWTSGNEKIDDFIQEKIDDFIQKKQLGIYNPQDIVFEWIPYNKFLDIEEVGKDDNFIIYSAQWKDGPLNVDEFLDEVGAHLFNFKIYGISQNPDTKDYIMILQDKDYFCIMCNSMYSDIKYKWCKYCEINKLKKNFINWSSGNEYIDKFIQEKQLMIDKYSDSVFEWIPYNKFLSIKVVDKDDNSTVYSAQWENGPLDWNNYSKKYERYPKKVSLKYLHNSQNVDEFLNEVKAYLNNFKIYGISQNPDTISVYIIALQNNDDYCVMCNSIYTNINYKWCKYCEINKLRKNFTSGNQKIDNFIQERQLGINGPLDIVFEWIPHNKFLSIKEVDKDGNSTVCLAQWEDGPLDWDKDNKKYKRKPKKIALKYSHNLKDVEFLNEVKAYLINFIVHGISQNLDTKDYVIALQNNDLYCIKCNKRYTDAYNKWCNLCEISELRKNFINWSSGNEYIDKFIQKKQLMINKYCDNVFEWIPHNKFIDIKEVDKDDNSTVYFAQWEDGPLYWDKHNKKYGRYPKKITLKYSHNLQEADEFLHEVKAYLINFKIYGISQNPDTKDYLMALQNNDDYYCIMCSNMYININYKWCKHCEINKLRKNFTYWTSENEKIDNFVQEKQLGVDSPQDIVFEWILYNKFLDFREVDKDDNSTVYLAQWENGPLDWSYLYKKYVRKPEVVTLKYLDNLQNLDEFLSKVKAYLINFKIYGISQNPNTKDYIMVMVLQDYHHCVLCNNMYTNVHYKWCHQCKINKLRKNFTNWTSGNETIDNFIQKKQLEINGPQDIVFEWIPYDKFLGIKIDKDNNFSTIYLAQWNDGRLGWDVKSKKYTSNPKEIALKYSHNIRSAYEFLNEVETYLNNFKIYGISQNTSTKDYIIVLQDKDYRYCMICNNLYTDVDNKWCKRCETHVLRKNFTNCTSGNEIIDDFIEEKQLEISKPQDIVFEWISYDKFVDVKEMDKNDFSTVYLAQWKNGPLYWDEKSKKYIRNSKEVVLKYSHNLQNVDEFLNEVKTYLIKFKIYGMSQNPVTKDYIIVLQDENYCIMCNYWYTDVGYKWCKRCETYKLKKNFTNWTSENEIIDNFIKEKQLEINDSQDIVFDWIPYDRFLGIKEVDKNEFSTIYLALWKDGPLKYNANIRDYVRTPNELIKLKCLRELSTFYKRLLLFQNTTNEFLNEVKRFSLVNTYKIYGISQNPNSKEYIIVFNDYCKKCDKTSAMLLHRRCNSCLTNHLKNDFILRTSGNKQIDNFVQEIRLKIKNYDDIVFEWIPHDQFNNIEQIGKGGFATVFSAIWKDGLLRYDTSKDLYIRNLNTKVALKYLYNSQNITYEFLNEVKAYSVNNSGNILKVYGITQDPNTKDYIIVLQYAEGRNFEYWLFNNYKYFNWTNKLKILNNIISGLKEIHQKQMVHRDFHVGNILFDEIFVIYSNVNLYISDMGLSREVDNIDKTSIYGVMPYVAPEVLRGKSYTQAADIYSFGMIMYFVATGRQPFYNRAHDGLLALDICEKVSRPEINVPEAPECYIDLMKKCWDTDPINRPDATKIEESIKLLCNSYFDHNSINKDYEIEKQFKEAETYRRTKNLSVPNNINLDTHPQAVFTSRLLNSFTNDLKTECIDLMY
ncbi:hypothetical protein RclHR1_00290032 [Rhizophagus clarus]|uniref:Protein kinase domain-containing protein n=1 Tax=Rhizophagus clarus TaxID=94130 RepID=A0A2Z6RG90_9GLOM|nr:hypothetical protein RclHR1_00290032 [Rhizophagus clarus]